MRRRSPAAPALRAWARLIHFRDMASGAATAPDDDAPAPVPGDEDDIVLQVVGEIGDRTSAGESGVAQQVIRQLASAPAAKPVSVILHSPGGHYLDAVAIAGVLDALRQDGRTVTGHVVGLCGGEALAILAACSVVRVANDAMLHLRPVETAVCGDARAIRAAMDQLEQHTSALVNRLAARATIKADAIAALMDDQTWLTAAEASTIGLCDQITTATADGPSHPADNAIRAMVGTTEVFAERAAAVAAIRVGYDRAFAAGLSTASLALIAEAPAKMRARVRSYFSHAPVCTALDVLERTREHPELVEELLDMLPNLSIAEVEARVATANAAVAARAREVDIIKAMCNRIHLPELATTLVESGMRWDQVRDYLAAVNYLLDARTPEISGYISTDEMLTTHGERQARRRAEALDPTSIYARRRAQIGGDIQ